MNRQMSWHELPEPPIFDKKVEQQAAKEKAAGEEDEEGWVTVSKR